MTTVETVRGIVVACRNKGVTEASGRNVLFIHGSGCDYRTWDRQFADLEDGWNLMAVDLPGHGSSGGCGAGRVCDYAAWIAAFIEEASLRRPVVVGHSLGAAVVLSLAIEYPHLISAVVPVGGGSRMAVNPAIFDLLTADPAAACSLIAKLSLFKPLRDSLSPFLVEMFGRGDPSVLAGDLRACDAFDVTGDLSRVVLPVLAVCGDSDKMTPPSLSRMLAEQIPGARLALIGESGHFPMLERPTQFNRVLGDFLGILHSCPEG
ncbi:MAG: alpha/beta hydrolase [Deltaproteobacteria bacterium]|nr:alpha/beta hydrolase [Deltaproteobacteria bacterium]